MSASHKLADAADGLAGFGESSDLEDVDHAGPDFESHGDTVGAGFLGDSDGVVAKHFVFAELNQQRRETSIVAEQRRGQWVARIGLR